MQTPRFLSAFVCAALVLYSVGRAQTTVFNDTFTGTGRALNTNPASPATPTIDAAAYQLMSSKTWNPVTSIEAGHLRFGIAATTSGHIEAQAVFTQYPIALANVGDYVEFSATFTDTAGLLMQPGHLCLGLYESGGSAPIAGGLNGTATSSSATAGTGGVRNWKGFVNRMFYTGASNKIVTRPAQTGTGNSNTNQDLLTEGSSSQSYSNPTFTAITTAASTLSLTAGAQYTASFRITLTAASTLQLVGSLHPGADTSGTALYTITGSATGASFLTSTFDGLALGWRATSNSAGATAIDVNAFRVVTNAATTIVPVIMTQPLAQTKGVGENVNLTVAANGGGAVAAALSYQWYKDGAAIALTENATAQSATLTFGSAALSDSGTYHVIVTNVAGSVVSQAVGLTITDGPIPPSIATEPADATILVGGTHTFTFLADGTSPLAYQWQFSADGGASYSDLSGDAASYTVSGATLACAGLYRCVVTNDLGSATTRAASLIVNQSPQITAQPTGGSFSLGDSVTLSVGATGAPAPTYQWRKNGVAIAGATGASYTIASLTGAHTANYTVVVTNSVGNVTSAPASIAVVSPGFAPTAFTPLAAATGLNPDTRLTLTFNAKVTPGVSGSIRIYDAATDTIVDTIELVAATALRDSLRAASTVSTLNLPVQNKAIGGTTNFNYYPVTVAENTATIYPRNNVLAHGKSYYVTVDAGTFVNAAGESFAGFSDKTTWTFSTKAAGPAADAVRLVVATDGSGDFDTVQAALDFVPANNTTPRTIAIKGGTYFEQVVVTNKHFLTIQGEDRNRTTIVYPNNNNFNNVSGGIYHRATFIASGVHDTTIAGLKFLNSTPQGGAQAEALIVSGSGALTARNLITRCSLFSYQDTLQVNKQCYVSDTTIEGDVDFLWGDGPCFFENCDIRILRSNSYFTQIRNGNGNHGCVFSNCRFTAGAGFTGTFFGRIDPKAASFPYSEVVLMNCRAGDAANNAFLNTTVTASGADYRAGWWLLNGTTDGTTYTSNIRNWTHNLVDKDGVALVNPCTDAFTVMPTDAQTIANYSDPFWVLNTTWAGVASGSWTTSLAPMFLTQPQSRTVLFETAVTFTVEVAAVPAATLQWRRNGADIPGATGATFTIAHASAADAGAYTCVATSGANTVVSATATLGVTDPAILTHPVSTSVNVGASATFSVTASGATALDYQWFKDDAPISGATGASYTILSATTADAGSYTVAVTNDAGTVTSEPAILAVVVVAPTITTHPVPRAATAGSSVSFTVAAAGSAPLAYQWYRDEAALSGATAATLTLANVGADDIAAYSVVVSNSAGSASSDSAALAVSSAPSALAAYLSGYGIDPAAASNLTLDSDLDGVNNLLEFVLGGRATTPDAVRSPVSSVLDGALVLAFDCRKPSAGVTVGVESSADLLTWSPVTDGVGGAVFEVTSVDSSFDHVQVALPAAGSRLFARVSASAVLAPAIAVAPAAVTVSPGQGASFSVAATGGDTLTYQWYKNGTAIVGATASTYSLGGVTGADEADYSVRVSNGTGFVTSSAAHLSVTNLPAANRLAVEGFATMGAGVTGGGLVDLVNPGVNYVVIDSSTANPGVTLKTYLESTDAYVIELKVDVDIGSLRNISAQPLLLPELIASGVGRIKVKGNKTLFSVHGATIRHGTLSIDNVQNVVIRNLKFRGLWEWDDVTTGLYDQMGWDYILVTNGAKNVWIDHCDFGKVYDGQADVTNGADLVTMSWCRFSGDIDGTVETQINHLESLYQANPADPKIAYYASLRTAGQTVAQIIAHELPQKKCSLVGSADNNEAVDAPGGLCYLNVTLHHNFYQNVTQRIPRMRYGNAHTYNLYIDGAGISSSAMSANMNAAVLAENCYFYKVKTPLTFSTTAPAGRIQARGSLNDDGTAVTGTFANQSPSDPAAWLFNSTKNFTWNDLTVLPYPYMLDAVDFTKNNVGLVGTIAPASPADAARIRAAFVGTAP
ncbi:MAG TPA: pectinesterase family protein [Opitutaceae bacterium]|nr:pectinesterase family protein [Opitutaceae bacterium]